MTKLIAGILASLCLITTAHSQHQLIGSVALSVGQWIIKNSKNVYYVRMEATGQTEAVARREAFAAACEQTIGSVVLSERESNSSGVTRNDVFNYSSCMVDDYKTVSVSPSNDGVRVVVDIWASDSRIANRLEAMGTGNGTRIDGEKIRREWEKDQSKHKADQDGVALMRRILDDYPRAAYTTKVTSTRVTRIDGRLAFSVTADIKLSEQYITALSEIIERTRSSSWNTTNGRGVKVYNGLLTHTGGVWADPTIQYMWDSALNRPVNMRLTFGGGHNQYANCWIHDKQFDRFTGYHKTGGVVDRGFLIVDGNLKMTITYNLINRPEWRWSEEKFINWVSGFSLIDAKIVDGGDCPV